MDKLKLVAKPGAQEFVLTRVLDAPRERVFKAMTDPAMIAKWWGPGKYATIVDKLEPRAGGTWRFINRGANGDEYGFHGVFHLVQPPERIIQTFEYEGAAGHVSLETMTLEERDGKTVLTAHTVFQSVADRDGMMQEGMEEGANESYDRLEELLKK
jgi:uncharacterized protein YndB with AHSA1/START domain